MDIAKNIYKTVKIVKIENESDKVKTFILDKKIKAKPGQYVMVWLPGINEKPFGIVNDDPLTFSIAKVGPFTEKIHQLKVGDRLTYRGPYGTSFLPKNGQILLIGGGYGVVPLYFLASIIKNKRLAIVVIGAKTKSDIIFKSKFEKLGCKVKISTDDGSSGFKGFSTDLTQKLLEKEKFKAVYTCGPEIMMKKIAELCHEKRIFCQVGMERFFKCGGLGLCGECSCKGHMVCKDGPVFNGKILL